VSRVVSSPVGGRSVAMLVVIVVVVYAHSIITVYGGVWSLLHRSRYGKSFIAFIPAFYAVWHRTFTCVLRAAELVAAVISFSVSVSGLQFPLSLCLCV
jgi:hypothetical protein